MSKQNLDRAWRFHLGDPQWGHGKPGDDSTWRLVDLPHDWSIELPRRAENPCGVSGGFFEMGRAWYRKTIVAPAEWAGKHVSLEFEGVYMNAEVRINEHYLGRHPYGYTSFHFDLTPYLKIGAENVISVCVDNSHQMNSRWYSGSGIYRHVWLAVNEPVHVARWGTYVTTPQVEAHQTIVQVRTRLENKSGHDQPVTLHSRVITPDGVLVAEMSASVSFSDWREFDQDLVVNRPMLWSPDSPLLYRLESEVEVAGQVVDRLETPFGIRTLAFSATEGFRLNGQPLKLKGGCVHHDNGILGSTSYDRAEERKVEIHKASGYNAIRCAHNPPSPAFLDACDRLGMLVIDEAFDCWREGKNPGDYHVAFDDWWQRDVDSMMYRDRNHPCIILWSIGNEVMERDGRSAGAEVARQLAARVRALDETRPVIAAMCGNWDGRTTWADTAAVFATLDVGGYNYQLANYAPDHALYPERMIIGTESTPMEAFAHWMAVEASPYVLGDFVWTSLDYLGESGIGRVHFDGDKGSFLGPFPWHHANCGDLDLCGFKRPQSFYRDILWKTNSPLYIAVHTPIPEGKTPKITYWGWPDVQPNWTWPAQENTLFKVDVYSACDQVELFLNGTSLGVQPSGQAEKFTATFDVPYQPGELKAVGYLAGQRTAETALHTATVPVALRLSPDRAHLRAGQQDLSYITVELLDANATLHPCADRLVSFTLEGPGTIAAVGSPDPTSLEAYRGDSRSTFHGRCLVVVKAGDEPGEIRLSAKAEGVTGAALSLKVD